MCTPASFVVTENNVYWSKKTDSHEDIIKEFKLVEMDGSDTPLFVRVEVTPPNGDMTIDLDKWIYKLDQDIKPRWYKAEKIEERTRTALKEWADARRFVSGTVESLKDGLFYVSGNATVKSVYGNATVKKISDKATYKKNGKIHAVKGAWKFIEE
jgi:hypothetical protein